MEQNYSFGIALVTGHSQASIAGVAKQLDATLGVHGAVIAAAVNGCSGTCTDGERRTVSGGQPGLQFIAAKLPAGSFPMAAPLADPDGQPRQALKRAQPFFVGKRQLSEISSLIMQLNSRTRVRGAKECSTARAWQQYLGAEDCLVRGVVLFVDPLASKYTVSQVLSGLDLAFPSAAKFGGVCSDLEPGRVTAAVCRAGWQPYGRTTHSSDPESAGVAGLLLPSNVALHSLVTPCAVSVGPELQVTKAKKQIIDEMRLPGMRDEAASQSALEAVFGVATTAQQRAINRDGFLLGFEAPERVDGDLDADRSKVYDDIWGSSERAPSYAALEKQAGAGDWLLRSQEPLPEGRIVVRRDDLKEVPPRVGARWLRMQPHVMDTTYGREELRRMILRYGGARLMLPHGAAPFGALTCVCKSWASRAAALGEGEVGLAELKDALGEDLPIASAVVCGEIAPQGVALGGVTERRTARHGHTASCCIFTYQS